MRGWRRGNGGRWGCLSCRGRCLIGLPPGRERGCSVVDPLLGAGLLARGGFSGRFSFFYLELAGISPRRAISFPCHVGATSEGVAKPTGSSLWKDVVSTLGSMLGVPLLGGFPFFHLGLAGISPRRATFFFASPKKKARKATRPPRSFAARMTALRCSQQAAGAELALRAQTAAPDFPACCCAARRGRNGL